MHKRLYILLVLLASFLGGTATPFVLPAPKNKEVRTTTAHPRPLLHLDHLQLSAGSTPCRPLPRDPGGSSLNYHHTLWFPLFFRSLPPTGTTAFEKKYIDHIYPSHHFW